MPLPSGVAEFWFPLAPFLHPGVSAECDHTPFVRTPSRRLRLLPFSSFFPFGPAYPPSVTRHRSCRNSSGACASPFPLCLFVVFHRVLPPIFLCLFLRFQSPRSLRIDCHQSLSGLFLPLSVSPARPRRTFGYTVGWPFSARDFRRFPFCCYRTPGFRRILYPFSFSFCPGFRPSFPFSFFPGCECHLTHWSPEPGQRVVPPFCGGSTC